MKKQVSKMNDRELDDFFKKLSAEPEIPYESKDWDKFEKILAANKVAQPTKAFKWYMLGSLLVAGLVFTLWMTVSTDRFQSNTDSSLPFDSSSLQTDSNVTVDDEAEPPMVTKPSSAILASGRPKHQITEKSDQKRPQLTVSLSEKKVATKPEASNPLSWASESKWALFDAFNRVLRLEQKEGIHKPTAIRLNPIVPLPQKNGIALGLLVAPDISAIRFDHFPTAGRSIGFSLDYFLGNSLSVSISAIHGQKRYRGGTGYWQGYDTAHQALFGDCRLIEIPLNIRYYPISGSKSRWFVSSGLSSYFMLKEEYSLVYQNYGGDRYTEEMEVNGSNQHLFGVWNMGLGYERKIGKKFTVQTEPYIRLPLVGIGEGNLDLKSLGVFVGIKYYPSNKLINF